MTSFRTGRKPAGSALCIGWGTLTGTTIADRVMVRIPVMSKYMPASQVAELGLRHADTFDSRPRTLNKHIYIYIYNNYKEYS